MEIEKLKQILEATRITTINRLCGLGYNVEYSPESAKKEILARECKSKHVRLCESQEDAVMAIMENKPPYTVEQSELIEFLNTMGIVAIPEAPPVKENVSDMEQEVIEEAVNKIFGAFNAARLSNDMTEEDVKDHVKSALKEEVLKIISK